MSADHPVSPTARRAQTYDHYGDHRLSQEYADGQGAAGGVPRSQSFRNAPDPTPPSYNAVMASEAPGQHNGYHHSPQTYIPSRQSTHSRASSIDQPRYNPLDYGQPSAYPAPTPAQGAQFDPRMNHRLSNSSRRPVSDPNGIDFSRLSFTSADGAPPLPPPAQPQPAAGPSAPGGPYDHPASMGNPGQPSRLHSAPHHPYPQGQGGLVRPPPRQRSVTGGYPDQDSAASVYSLDSGGATYGAQNGYAPHETPPHASQPGWNPYGAAGGGQGAYAAQADFPNPYYSAANDFLGLPPGSQTPSSNFASSSTQTLPTILPSQQAPMAIAPLNRTNTSLTTASAISTTSTTSLTRQPTESVGASSTRRRGVQVAIDLNKPPFTKQYVDDYRRRMKDDPDPEAQFAFSKYLIEAAKKIGDEISVQDPRLGRKYRDTLLQESLRNIKKLAEGKEPFPDAQFFLANLHGTGQIGVQVDHEKAYYLYLMASKLNHAAATYRAAVCNEIGAGTKKDFGRAVLFYRKAAALGDASAMYKLGMILLTGTLQQQRNPREAIVWLRRAAAQADEDNPHALYELAMLHERPSNGQVVPHDLNMARELYLQAAQLNYAPAQTKLGAAFEHGNLGCPIDPRRSIGWYTRAAERGEPEAELSLSGWYLTGSEGVLKQSDTEAYLWGRKAANKGFAKAEYAVGYYTEIGIGIKQDIEAAKRWYMRSAAQQHKPAMQRLTELNNAKNARMKRANARPTRQEASSECTIM